jgi:hypothetical protein
MKIKNKTHYDTEILSLIFAECIQEINKIYSIKISKIKIKYRYDYHGRAMDQIGGYCPALFGKWITILLPPISEVWRMESWTGKYFSKAQLVAMVFFHEVGHLFKFKHNKWNATIEMDYKEFIIRTFTEENYPL